MQMKKHIQETKKAVSTKNNMQQSVKLFFFFLFFSACFPSCEVSIFLVNRASLIAYMILDTWTLKFRLFEKQTYVIWKNLPHGFDIY